MFPIRSLRRRTRLPIVTIAIIVINLLVFAYELTLGPDLPDFIQVLGMRPAFFLTYWPLPYLVVWLPWLSSMFLHAGWLHLGGNMLFLWVFGANVEDRLGHSKFFVLYLLGGFIAALAQVLMAPDSLTPIIGASGAIAGVLGAHLLLFPRAQITTLIFIVFFPLFLDIPAVVLLLVWFLTQFAAGIAALETGDAFYGGVAIWGHIGGFVAGILLGGLLRWL